MFRAYLVCVILIAFISKETECKIDCFNGEKCVAEVNSVIGFVCTEQPERYRDWYLINKTNKILVFNKSKGVVEYPSQYIIFEDRQNFGIENLNPSGLGNIEYFSNTTEYINTTCKINILAYG